MPRNLPQRTPYGRIEHDWNNLVCRNNEGWLARIPARLARCYADLTTTVMNRFYLWTDFLLTVHNYEPFSRAIFFIVLLCNGLKFMNRFVNRLDPSCTGGTLISKKKTKCLIYSTLDKALQPSRLFRRSHTDRSVWSCDSRSYPGVARLNVITLKWWEMLSKREGEQRKLRVVDSRLSVGNSLRPVLVKKGWVGGGVENVQKAWLESTMGINLWSPATSYPVSICVACFFLVIFSQLLIHARWQKSGQCTHSSSGVWNSHLMSSGTASANV